MQSRLFPRPGQSPVQNRSYAGTMYGQPARAMTLMDVGDQPQGPLAQLMQGGAQRAQVPMAGPHGYQQASPLQRMMGAGPRPAPQAPILPTNHPLFGMNTDQMRKMVQAQQDKLGSPIPTAQEMGYVPQPVTPQPMAPIGTRLVGGVEYSGSRSYPGQLSVADPNYGQGFVSRTNRDAERLAATPTLAQAAADQNYNANGALFQGAKLGMNPNGSAFFREGPRPTDFAGSAQTADEAAAKRLRGLKALEDRGVGYIDKATGAFFGRGARTFPSDGNAGPASSNPAEAIRGRLAAGGVTPSDLTPDQLAQNRLATIQRLADKRQSAMARVTQLAQENTAARRERLNPSPLQRMLQNNPQAAMAFQAQQNQFNHDLALQNARNQGLMGVAQLEGANNVQRNQFGLLDRLVANGMDPNEARRQAGLQPLPGAQAPNALPKFQPGSFAGANKQTFDYLKETLKDLDDENALSLMDEMGVPTELRAGLLDRVKPSWWRRINKEANAGTAGGQGVAPMIPGWTR